MRLARLYALNNMHTCICIYSTMRRSILPWTSLYAWPHFDLTSFQRYSRSRMFFRTSVLYHTFKRSTWYLCHVLASRVEQFCRSGLQFNNFWNLYMSRIFRSHCIIRASAKEWSSLDLEWQSLYFEDVRFFQQKNKPACQDVLLKNHHRDARCSCNVWIRP